MLKALQNIYKYKSLIINIFYNLISFYYYFCIYSMKTGEFKIFFFQMQTFLPAYEWRILKRVSDEVSADGSIKKGISDDRGREREREYGGACVCTAAKRQLVKTCVILFITLDNTQHILMLSLITRLYNFFFFFVLFFISYFCHCSVP